MAEATTREQRFLRVFVGEDGSLFEPFKDKSVDDLWWGARLGDTEYRVHAAIDGYSQPRVNFLFKATQTNRTSEANISSLALLNPLVGSEDTYVMPLPISGGLQVEVSGDGWGVRSYRVPNDDGQPVTMSVLDSSVPIYAEGSSDSSSVWAEALPVSEDDAKLIRQLIDNALSTCVEVAV